MKDKKGINLVCLALSVLHYFCSLSLSYACPLIGGLVDLDCNGVHKIVVIGDSVVFGRGDTLNNNAGGYVLRLGEIFPASQVYGMGYPGYTSARIFQRLRSDLRTSVVKSSQATLKSADLIIIDAGRNDYFDNVTPGLVTRNLARLVKLVRRYVRERTTSDPLVAVSTLLPTGLIESRALQSVYISTINQALIENSSDLLPVKIRFDLLSSDLISTDGLHPSSSGYDVIAQTVEEYVRGPAQKESRRRRPDLDHDGIYDFFEKRFFGTDPIKKDSDGDGLSDGEEQFLYGTSPRTSDTDGDGISDFAEIDGGSDPLE